MVGVPNKGNARSFYGTCVQDGMIIPKINTQASAPISYPLCFELAFSRTKKGEIEEIVISCIFQTSSMWSVPPRPEC